MNRVIIVMALCILLLGCATLSLNSYSDADAEIYEWVKARMKITENYPRPEVKRITQKELGRLFKKNLSKEAYDRWVAEIGEEGASEHLQNIVDKIRGVFIVEDIALYIANDVGTSVYQEGIVAHEYIHYLQQMSLGIVDTDSEWGVMEYFNREMMAAEIGKEYIEHICPKCDEKGVIKEE